MNIDVIYSYDGATSKPYKAKGYFKLAEQETETGVSDESYQEAKENLLERIKKAVEKKEKQKEEASKAPAKETVTITL